MFLKGIFMNVLSLHAVIICWCHQKGVMSDRVITVIAREKAINDTEGLGETQDDDISCKITVGSFCSAAFLKWGNFNTTIFFVRKTREQFVHCGAPDNCLCTDTKSLYHRSPDGSTQCGWKMCTLVVIPINDNILPHCIKYGNVYFQSNVFSHLIIHPLCLAVVR